MRFPEKPIGLPRPYRMSPCGAAVRGILDPAPGRWIMRRLSVAFRLAAILTVGVLALAAVPAEAWHGGGGGGHGGCGGYYGSRDFSVTYLGRYWGYYRGFGWGYHGGLGLIGYWPYRASVGLGAEAYPGYSPYFYADASQQPPPDGRARLMLLVPENAEVFIDGQPTAETGTEREFFSPVLEPGKFYTYAVRVRYPKDGRIANDTRRIEVRADDRWLVDFTRPAPPGGAVAGTERP
jgi:uncharacterized protein (TIGR03000 family)